MNGRKGIVACFFILLFVCISNNQGLSFASGPMKSSWQHFPLDDNNTGSTAGKIPFSGTTLYVGGNGPNNYSSIQSAIDNATPDDTVFVYKGVYNESILIDKPLRLIGEDRNGTIIEGNHTNTDIIVLETNGTTVCGFQIQNSGYNELTSGVLITKNHGHNFIKDNYFINNSIGILLKAASDNQILGNIIEHNRNFGIAQLFDYKYNSSVLMSCDRNVFSGNRILSNSGSGFFSDFCYDLVFANNTCSENGGYGMFLWPNYRTTISGNVVALNDLGGIFIQGATASPWTSRAGNINHNLIIGNGGDGLNIWWSMMYRISYNDFEANHGWGLSLADVRGSQILHNNFLNCSLDALFFRSTGLRWYENYWNQPLTGSKAIKGSHSFFLTLYLWYDFDWHPAKKPYIIT